MAAAAPDDEPDGSEVVTAAFSVAWVARRLGIAPSTLRTWDRRYGLGPRGRSAGSHRRYTNQDLQRLLEMRRLTLDGIPPAEAARRAAEASDPSDPAPTERPGRHGGGRVVPVGSLGPADSTAARGLARAAMALDFVEMTRLLSGCLREHGVHEMWHALALPVLTGLGTRWESTGQGVEVEHALCQVVTAVLGGERPEALEPHNARPVLLASPDGEQHVLALNVLEFALAEQGLMSRLLGVGMPRRALVDATMRTGPSVVFLYARLECDDWALLAELPRQRPAPRIIVGGPGWDGGPLPGGVRRANTLSEAVTEVLAAARP